MDPEQTFIRVQERFSHMLTPRFRIALEYIHLVVALSIFGLLVVMHANYVQQPGCSSELSVVEAAEAQLVHIKISSIGMHSNSEVESDVLDIPESPTSAENIEVPTVDGDGFTFLGAKIWLNWMGSGVRRSKLVSKSSKTDNEYLEPQTDSSVDGSIFKVVAEANENKVSVEDPHTSLSESIRESFKAAANRFCSRWRRRFTFFSGHAKHFLWSFGQLWNTAGANVLIDIPKWSHVFRLDRLNAFAEEWLEKRGRSFEPTYLYTMEKGYFLLPEGAKSQHNIHTVNISISARHPCFGNRWQQLLINRFVGYDTILMNSLLSSPGKGYLYNYQTKEFYDLSYAHDSTEGSTQFGDYLVTKCGVLIMSLFVFFTTTMSVSFTLRETQTRMLKFTVQLEHHARHRLPTFQLIFVHVIESLVFVPIMIGILFFLFEFYDDQLLAFMVLIVVWMCELFTLISVRTPISMKFFPRFFLLYFLVFHIYFFSYPYGFTYLAFAATSVFMQHLILYFWNRFEVPALQRFIQTRRSQMQHQANIHITSSTILASTLHITRLNMRNPERRPPPINVQSQTSEPNNNGPEATPNPTPLNPFSSMLLWILAGASSEGLNSFLSLFRDVRDQGGQAFPDAQQENHPA
ncbi:hypothetical protein ACHQM5_004269 [Ranunculus cassubicifolius]